MKSIVQTQCQFRSEFPGRNFPTLTIKHFLELHTFRRTGSVQDKSQWPAKVNQDRKLPCDCETMFGAITKKIRKTFISEDRSFKEFS